MATSTINNTHIIEPQIATDMDIEVYGHDGIHFNRYDNNTAHTPYKEELTLAAEGFAVTFMRGDYGSQTVYPNGQAICEVDWHSNKGWRRTDDYFYSLMLFWENRYYGT